MQDDITARREQVEQALRENQGLYRHLVESAHAIPWEVELETWRFTYVGSQAVALLGYPLEEWYEQDFWIKHIHPEDRETALSFCQAATTRGEDHEFEYRMLAANGNVVWIRDSVTIVTNEHGPIALRGYMFDITAYKQAFEALSHSESQFEAMFNAIPDAVILADTERRIMMNNPAVHDMFGYSNEELIGHTTEMLYADPADFKNQGKHRYRVGPDTEQGPYEVRYKCKDGSVFWCETLGTQVRDTNGAIIGFIGLFRDITKRKQTEAVLNDKEARIRTIFDSALDALIVINEKSIIGEWNPQAETTFGWKKSEIIGRSLMETIIPPSYREAHQRGMETLLATDDGPILNRRMELTALHREGNEFPIELTISPLHYDGTGTFSAFVRDLTERKQVERELQKSEESFKALAEKSPNMIFINRRGRVVYANKACEDQTGYKREEFYADDFDFMCMIAPGSKELIKANFQHHLRGEEIPPYEYKILTKDKRELTIIQATRLIEFKGQTSTLGIITDITERKQAEKALRESEKYNRMLFEQSTMGLALCRMNGELVDINPAYARIIGRTMQETLKLTYWDITPESYAADEQRQLRSLEKTGRYGPYEKEYIHKDGHLVPVRLQGLLLAKDGEQMIWSSVDDITERKRTEEIVRNIAAGVSAQTGEAFFRHLVEHLSQIFGADYAFIGVLNKDDPPQINTLAVYAHGQIVDNMSYLLAGTPCANVMGQNTCAYPNGVQQQFPEDPLLVEMGVEGYIGTPLFDSHGVPMGILVVLDSKPLQHIEQVGELLEIFAARAGAELERMLAEEKVRASEKELSAILNSLQDTYYRVDSEGRIIRVSPSVYKLLGYAPHQLLGTRLADLYVDPQGREKILQQLEKKAGIIENYEALLRHKDGSNVWVSTNAHYIRDKQGTPIEVEGTARDINQIKAAEDLRHRFGRILDNSSNEIYIFDAESMRFSLVNRGARHNLGYSMQELEQLTALDLKPDHSMESFAELLQPLRRGDQEQVVFQTRHRRKDGSLYPVEVNLQLSHEESPPVFVAIIQDISERMQTKEQLQYLAQHDALTSLPNRLLFTDRLDQSLARAHWHDRSVAVLFLDLDRFKIINDTLGHDVGDHALQALSERLNSCVRDGDTVARLGGDEFAIVLEDIATAEDVAPTARKIMDVLSQPFKLDKHEFFITTSIGISLFPIDGKDRQTLLKHADVAMHRAKEQGRNTYQFYSADMSAKAFERLGLETSLRHALEREEFVLYYQPQLDLKNGRVVGVEALLRWQHPDLGLVPPVDFVPLLEETGLIIPVGEWVLRTACLQACAWNDSGLKPLRMSVNLSGRQTNNSSFIATVEQVLKDSKLDPALLELEMTESILMDNVQTTIKTLETISAAGIRLAIDDFGTGYSSLSYLKRFPINTLKIDRSFIHDLTQDPDDATLVEAIIAMARTLHLNVIAEGVETEAQVEFLRSHNCDSIQGFLISQPQPAQELTTLLREKFTITGKKK